MINFFRKIRQQMLNQNKTSRYFKYALGEIILVVFGILIALQINNWNENRKAANEETKILKALQVDFKDSKNRIEETMSSQQKVLDHSSILINIHERADEKEFEYFDTHLDSLKKLIDYGTTWYRTEPVTGAYNALISAGKVDLIKNEKLRHELAQFSADLESGFEDQQPAIDLLTILQTDVSPFILEIAGNTYRKRFNISPRKHDTIVVSKQYFSNKSYFGNLLSKHQLEFNRINRQKSLLNQTYSILKIIEQELLQD